MENASKALIIAAAILLSILIIALGMRVYNNASSSAGSADLSSQEISSHNAQFEAYEGRQKGTQVKTLLNLIAKNNEEYEDRKITIFSSTVTGFGPIKDRSSVNNLIEKIDTKTTYKITFSYSGSDGLVSTCMIKLYE